MKVGAIRSGPRSRRMSTCSTIPAIPPIAVPKRIPTRSGGYSAVELRVGDRLLRGAEREEDVAVEPARVLWRSDRGRVEVLHLRRDAHRELARVERGDPVDAALAGDGGAPRRRRSPPIGVTAPSPVTTTRFIERGYIRGMSEAPGPNVPFPPMEAELVAELPSGGGGWRYEPKWDGFRGVLENDGGELALWSRNGRPLLRYFPELREVGDALPPHSALDGEIVIARNGALDFDAMQMRLHPAESRVRKLSAEIPATFVAFDLLLWKGKAVHEMPIEKRRAELEKVAGGKIQLSPVSDDVEQGREWLQTLQAAGFDGVIAKKLGLPYLPGSRDGVVKVKPHKTADCVVAGIRWKKGGRDTIATLLLGLYGDEGELHYVGSAAVGAKNQAEIAAKVLPLLDKKSDRRFSEPNRWGTDGLEEAPLKPKLVVEVRFDKLEKHRFRHGTRLLRFRPDKDPAQCTWREVRPPRRASDLAVEDLLG